MNNRITQLLGIRYPLIQAGMIWCSGWKLAAAVSNAGGLGIIGAGSMYPDVLRHHIRRCRENTTRPFGVNIPLLYPDLKEIFDIVAEEKIDVVITSAGNPATWTAHLKSAGSMVIHVVSNTKFAIKAEQAGVDAIVAEGFEAGGHNGREETTTFCLIPMIKKTVQIPIIAAGGIGSGSGMLAAMALGAEGVQIGSRFVATVESSAHEHFKQKLLACREGDTSLHMKQLTPVRLLKNGFQQQVANAEARGAGAEELQILLGRGRAKKGMFEGDMEEGELEIGQIAALIRDIQPAADVVEEIMEEFRLEKEKLCKSVF